MLKKYGLYIFLLIIALIVIFLPIKFKYKVYTTGKVFTSIEWLLTKGVNGKISATTKNNEHNLISEYEGREFQTGDLFNFQIEPSLMNKTHIKKDEILGKLYSKSIQTEIIRLQDLLNVEKASYKIYASGEKPTIINEAKSNLDLAIEKQKDQLKIYERSKVLYRDSIISQIQLDQAKDAYDLAKINVQIYQAQLLKLSSGDKQEQLDLSNQKISAIENQLKELNSRLESYLIKAPFTGLMQKLTGVLPTLNQEEIIIDLLDTTSYIIIAPVATRDAGYLKLGAESNIIPFNNDNTTKAKVVHIDNTIQLVGGRQSVYVTLKIDKNEAFIWPGTLVRSEIYCDELTTLQYLARMWRDLFYK